jgi:hypothetical protein
MNKTSSDTDLELPSHVTFNGLLNPISFTVLSARNSTRNYMY